MLENFDQSTPGCAVELADIIDSAAASSTWFKALLDISLCEEVKPIGASSIFAVLS